MAPVAGLTAEPAAGGMVLAIPVLIATLVDGLLAWGIVRLFWILADRWAGLKARSALGGRRLDVTPGSGRHPPGFYWTDPRTGWRQHEW